jgi:hypothetical protein
MEGVRAARARSRGTGTATVGHLERFEPELTLRGELETGAVRDAALEPHAMTVRRGVELHAVDQDALRSRALSPRPTKWPVGARAADR